VALAGQAHVLPGFQCRQAGDLGLVLLIHRFRALQDPNETSSA
jgi:hypothetical protein